MDKMKVKLCFLVFFFSGINYANSLDLSPSAIAKTLHTGAYEAVKETVNTVTEVVGTPVDIKDVHFFLHTSKDHGYPNYTVDPLNPAEMATKEGKVYFLIHGWTQNRQKTPWYRPLTEYLLKKHPEAHVIQLDWGKAAANIYASAAFCTESVGNIIGDVIKKLVVDYNVPRKNIVVIGHSLGGQISGWVGKRFRKLTNHSLPRIIALDPAGPLFLSRPEEKRLNKHDAEVVMVLHSDGGKLGFGSSCGTIDFFPNGGSDQPGCFKVDLDDVSTLAEPIWCDHQRGYNLFLEAVKSPCLFLAKKCENYDKFKENKCEDIAASLGDLEAFSSGSYYFNTTSEAPFIKIDELKKHERYLQHSRNGMNDECLQLLRTNRHDNHSGVLKSESHDRNRESIRNSNGKQADEGNFQTYEEGGEHSNNSNSQNERKHNDEHRYSSKDSSQNKRKHNDEHRYSSEGSSQNERKHNNEYRHLSEDSSQNERKHNDEHRYSSEDSSENERKHNNEHRHSSEDSFQKERKHNDEHRYSSEDSSQNERKHNNEHRHSSEDSSQNERKLNDEHIYSSAGSLHKFEQDKHSRREENHNSNNRQNKDTHQDRNYEENGSITPVSYQKFENNPKKLYQSRKHYE